MQGTGAEIDVDAIKRQAAALRKQGCNCAQAMACAFAPHVGLDEGTAMRLAQGFGAGMGGFTETCGAISGGVMVLGQVSGNGPGEPVDKQATYRLTRRLVDGFREKNGSTLCGELKGIGREHPPLRSCPGCIEDAVELTADVLRDLRN